MTTAAPSERTFFSDAGITITQARIVVPGQTYAMSGVTSVATYRKDPSRTGPIVLGILGVLSLIGGAKTILGALIFLGLAVAWWMALKPTFIVKLTSAAGEREAFTSKDESLVDRLVSAINEAIIARG